MYFTQTLDGAIPESWYQTDDSPYFVNVKVSAINAFQTRVVQPGSPLQAQEHDPVGYHYSTFVGSDKVCFLSLFSFYCFLFFLL
jgi:hypothetical protein